MKSNLEALYRNENGEIVWQDRMGTDRTDAEQLAANKAFPMLVNKIYTKVPHQTDPLFKNPMMQRLPIRLFMIIITV